MQYVIDVGAHVGWFAYDYVQSGDTVFMFEPVSSNLNILRHKFIEDANAVILPFAVGPTNGKTRLYRATDDEPDKKWIDNGAHRTGRSSMRSDNNNVSKLLYYDDISVVKLSDFYNMMGIERYAILKIDTEGMEHPILEDLLNNGLINKFDEILFENHEALFDFNGEYRECEAAMLKKLDHHFHGKLNTIPRWTH